MLWFSGATFDRWTKNKLGEQNKHLWPFFAKCIVDSKKLGTKVGYMGLLSDYVDYCKRQGVPPTDPDNPDSFYALAVMYWMAEKTSQRGHCNSFPTWSAALTWGARHLGLTRSPRPLHQNNQMYINFKEDLLNTFTRKAAEKVPCTVHLIVRYMRE